MNCCLMIVVWTFPAFIFFLPVFNLWGTMGYDPGTHTCTMADGDFKGSPRRCNKLILHCSSCGLKNTFFQSFIWYWTWYAFTDNFLLLYKNLLDFPQKSRENF